MDYRNADPGAVQFGNFINYYNFNSAEDRLKLLPTNVWLPEFPQEPATDRPYLVLDVGCNSGVFTQLLWKFLREHTGRRVHVLGIDIDPSLINRARESNQQMDNVSFDTVDVMNDSDFPRVMDFLHSHERSRFDAVCCFSITMWIHLNHHDIGLQNFLRKLAVIADLFVVEPQPWKCYQTAERRMKKAGEVFSLFLELKWRSNVEQEIQNFMENDLGRRKTFECCPTKWKRRICFYRDKNES